VTEAAAASPVENTGLLLSGQTRRRVCQHPSVVVVAPDSASSGQYLAEQVGGQMRRQIDQRPSAGVVAGHGDGGGQRLGQACGVLVSAGVHRLQCLEAAGGVGLAASVIQASRRGPYTSGNQQFQQVGGMLTVRLWILAAIRGVADLHPLGFCELPCTRSGSEYD